MGVILGFTAVSVAVVALFQLTTNTRVRRLTSGLFGRALPGARTGEPQLEGPRRAEPSARLEWTEVSNLTAAKLATRPGGPPAARPETETAPAPTAVELRR
jgi:hypothetical protein